MPVLLIVFVEGELTRIGTSVNDNKEIIGSINRLQSNSEVPTPIVLGVEGRKDVRTEVMEGGSVAESIGTTHVATVIVPNKVDFEGGSYVLGLEETSKSGVYSITNVSKKKIWTAEELEQLLMI